MAAVTKRLMVRVLALAHGHLLLHILLEFNRFEARAFVRAVAPGLRLRPPAAAPPVRAGFEFQDGGGLRGYNGLVGHGMRLL